MFHQFSNIIADQSWVVVVEVLCHGVQLGA
jgi:hypothetical protein